MSLADDIERWSSHIEQATASYYHPRNKKARSLK